ncbi:MAG: hypothetical protein JNM07_13885 [Phycisphaerae bacterium]|nr:hypothetical protein [Phycisphaerae bacterium]
MRSSLAVILGAMALLGVSCSTPERSAGVTRPDGDDPELERAGGEPTTDAARAYEWRRLAWLDERGNIPPGARRAALAQRSANIAAWSEPGAPRVAGIYPTRWTSRGPSNVGGRTSALLIHPTQTNRLWAGAVGGGIWASTDGGLSWAPSADHLNSLSVSSMAMAPSNPSIMYAGTGESFLSGDGIFGMGMYKSVDAGVTWNPIASTQSWVNNDVFGVAVSPTNPNLVLAARFYQGIFRSANGGASWSSVYWAQGGICVAFDPTNAARCVATVADWNPTAGEWFHRALYSTNGGLAWQVAAGLDYKPGFFSRIALAYSRGSPSIVYATSALDKKIFKSTDGGRTYAPVTAGAIDTDWFRCPLWVDPTNPNILMSGMGHVMRSTDGGVTFTQISNGYINTTDPHPDIHAIYSDPGFNGTTNKRVYIVTDGGVYKTEDAYTANQGAGWSRLEQTYRTTQFYAAAGDGPTGKVYGGTQDNGHLLLTPGSDTASFPFGGDGGYCAIDWSNTNFLYGEYITLMIHRSKDGGASVGYIVNGLADAGVAANFIAPFILDPNNSNTMLAGGASLWRSKNVRTARTSPTWASIRPPGSSLISAIAVAPGNSDIIYVAQNDGRIDRTTNGTAGAPTWTAVDDNGATNPLPDRYCTRLVIDPLDHRTVYAAFGGFSPDNVWRTSDAGATWQPVSGAGATALPSVPVRGLTLHPSRRAWLYAGTEVGVFASADGGNTWSTRTEGPDAAAVYDLTFFHNSTTLLCATHGRGLWTAPTDACAADFNGDTSADDFDFYDFLNTFFANSAAADFNGDTSVDDFDYFDFLNAFGAGC